MPNIILGKNVNVETLVNGEYVTIGCAVSCSFEFENELIGKTDVNAGLSRKKRVRISDNRGSVQGLTTLNNSAAKLSVFYFLQEGIRRAEQTMRYVFQDEGGTIKYITGTFLVRAVNLTADTSGFSEFDLQIEGTGGVEIGTVDPPDIFCPELFSDTWDTVEGETSISGPGLQGRSYEGNEILVVFREGGELEYNDTGTAGNREYAYDGVNISVDPTNPFNPGERMSIVWKAFES